MNKYLISFLILIVFVSALVTGYLFLNNSQQKNLTQNPVTQNVPKIKNQKNVPSETVTLTSTGFNPQVLTIKTGTRIVWLNNSGVVGTVNSDNYPTNLLYPFLNFGQFANGSSFSTVFNKPGTYTYYNFLSQNQSQKGTVIVE